MAAQRRVGTRTIGVPIAENYKYVNQELLRTGIISGVLVLGMVVLEFFMR